MGGGVFQIGGGASFWVHPMGGASVLMGGGFEKIVGWGEGSAPLPHYGKPCIL